MCPFEPDLHRKKMAVGWSEVANDYQEITVPFLAQYLPELIDAAGLKPKMNVVDVGAGTGLASMEAARRILPEGRVLATDLSDRMLELARTIFEKNGIDNIDIYNMPAELLDIDSETFERVICSFSLPFFQEPEKALREMHRVLRFDGKLALSTWAAQNRAPVLGIMDTALKDLLPVQEDDSPPSVFAFGDEDTFNVALEEVGFENVQITSITHSARYKKAEDYWDRLYRTGPELRDIVAGLAPEQVDSLKSRVVEDVEKFRNGDKIVLPSEALIATGTK